MGSRGLWHRRWAITLISLLCINYLAVAQETIVHGKVTDAASGDPIPYANVLFKGTDIGMTTDFEGKYEIKTQQPSDSLLASYVGYETRTKKVIPNISQEINFQLNESVTHLAELVFHAGENPAFDIMRNVVRNKPLNDRRSLTAYQYDAYSKIEVDVDNMSEKFRQKKVMQRITQVMDSVDRIAGEDGKPVLPLFISETASNYYRRLNPDASHEDILHTKISGVGIEDGSLISQLVGSSFQEYNFYQNWLNILSKDFVSPMADGWRLYYDYELTDSSYIGDDFCYRLDFTPKSEQDLAFSGSMWITKNEYALKQIDVTVGKRANLNFIERIKIQQELEKSSAGPWVPSKNRLLIDVGEINDQWAGMLAKFYTSNRNIVVNQPRDAKFYETAITLKEDYKMHQDEDFWNQVRHDPLTSTEKSVYKMIDTLQNIPIVKTYVDIIKVLINGYQPVGKVDVGPYLSFLAVNNIEGLRLQAGFRTNIHFSDHWVFGAQLGYGFKDQKIKYEASVENILDRKRWTTLTLTNRSDLTRIGLDEEALADDYLFLAAERWGYIRRGYYFNESRFDFQRELFKGYSQKLAFRYTTFEPTYNFAYYTDPNDLTAPVASTFQTAEVILESRIARDESFVQDDNQRVSLGTSHSPIITLRYTHGLKGILGSDFEYDKVRMMVDKRIKLGPFGTGYANLTGEYIFSAIPYPLLGYHLGNQTIFYTDVTSNLMDYGEFVSDHYAALQYHQHFGGFLLNRIPLMRRLKWRLTGSADVIYGGLSESNRSIIAGTTAEGAPTLPVGYFDNRPYVELGYGIENIFKVGRIEFVHRLSYLDNPDARRFGILVTFQFTL